MKRPLTRIVACALTAAIVVTGYPASTVSAANASSVLPASGGILAVGNGVSLKDIKAERARSVARQKVQTVHNNVSDKAAEGSEDAGILTASTSDNIDISIKAETPASKAVHNGETVNGTSVVGRAADAASMTVAETEEAKELVAAAEAEAQAEAAAEAEAEAKAKAASVSGNAAGDVSGNTVSGDKADENKTAETKAPEKKEKKDDGPTIEVYLAAGNFDESDAEFANLVIAQVSYYVNVRDIPSEDGEVVGKLYNNSAGEWLDKEGDWYKIKSGNVTGYVKSEFVVVGEAAVALAKKVGERVAVVTTTTLKVREEASLDSAVLGLVPMEDRLTVVEETDEWVKVSIEEGDGWVNKEFVKVSTEFPKAESKAEEEARLRKEEAARRAAIAAANKAAAAKKGGKGGKGGASGGGGGGAVYSASGSGAGASVANYALQFVGNPYVYGGSSLTGGTDCSGFTMGVYRNFGISLPHSSGAQRSCGYSVGSLANAQAGDIVCYSGHVGIYIGGGQIVHASTAKTGIKVSNAGYRSVLDVRRIF